MMQIRKSLIGRLVGTLFVMLLLFPASSFAQGTASVEALDEWFLSRLLWGSFIAAGAGALVGWVHLCELSFELGELHLNKQARRKFGWYTIGLLVVGGLFLLMDAWLLFPFSTASMSFSDAFTTVWMGYRTLAVLLLAEALFATAVAISTRLKPTCRCRYAFLPGPRGREISDLSR
jgi:hypothetical protein